MMAEFIDEDIFGKASNISELYWLAQSLRGKTKFDKKEVDEMYGFLAISGVIDSTINDKMNTYYKKVFNNILLDGKPIRKNPFIIEEGSSTFIDQQYKGITSKEEIIANEINLANRLAKIPDALINTRNKETKTNSFQWSIKKRKLMTHLYQQYQKCRKKTLGYWDFFSDIEFSDNGEIDNDLLKRRNPNSEEIVFKDNEDENQSTKKYRKFLDWYKETYKKWWEDNSQYNNISDEEIEQDLPKFHKFCRLKICDPIFYGIKNNGIAELINLQKDGKVKVYDASEQDKSKRKGVLLKIQIPGYNEAFFVHTDIDKIFNNNGLNKKNSLQMEKDQVKKFQLEKSQAEIKSFPRLNFRLTKEQIEFIKQIDLDTISAKGNEKYIEKKVSLFKQIIQYMQDSIEYQELLNSGKTEKMKEFGSIKRTIKKIQEESDLNEENGNKLKERRSYTSRRPDDEFIKEVVLPVFEKYGITELPEDYEKKLRKGSGQTLDAGFEPIEKFMSEKLENQSQESIQQEAIKMMIYMKLKNKGYSVALNSKDKNSKNKIYSSQLNEYNAGFLGIVEAIKDGAELSASNSYINKSDKKKIGTKPKTEKKLKGKKNEVKKLKTEKDKEVSKRAYKKRNGIDISQAEKVEKQLLTAKEKSKELIEKNEYLSMLIEEISKTYSEISKLKGKLAEYEPIYQEVEKLLGIGSKDK